MKYLSIFLTATMLFYSCNLINNTQINGNGKIVSKNYDLKDFDKVDVSGGKNVYIKQDSVFSVRIETDENFFDYLQVEMRDGELNISTKKGVWLDATDEVKVFVSMPVIQKLKASGISSYEMEGGWKQDEKLSIELSGVSKGEFENVWIPNIQINASGASEIAMSSESQKLSAEVSGASKGNFSNVRIPEIRVTTSGASEMTMNGESKNLSAEVNGASTFEGFDLKAEDTNVEASGASTAKVFASITLKANASGASTIQYKGNPDVKTETSGASNVEKKD